MECNHKNTYFDSKQWPTGEAIEICEDCEMSRAHWEQGTSNWYLIDVENERIKLQESIQNYKPHTQG